MKIYCLFTVLLLTQGCFAQPVLQPLNQSTLPKNIHYTGTLVSAGRWTDQSGDNIVILYYTSGKTPVPAADKGSADEEESNRSAHLYAAHYLVEGDTTRLSWTIHDFSADCPVDLFVYFIDNAFAITDLNKDGHAEVWVMYKNSCQGDVSPIPMKIIMYQANKKYAVRGSSRVTVSATEMMGGEYVFDDAFKKAPAAFRQYAAQLWQKNKMEKWTQ
jgi:hypothetical protein